MHDNKQYIKLSLVLIAIIAIPAFQTLTRFLPEKKLNGVVYNKPLPDLNWENWIHFRYQPDLNNHVEQNFGFRTSFVRLYNQIEYSLFKQPHASGVVIGKDGYLFEEWFITAHYGTDYVGDERIKLKIRQLNQVRSYFNQHGKELMVIVAPSKADLYPEFIPERMKYPKTKTNYAALIEEMNQSGIPLLDFNHLFISIKDTATCALFPKTGIHWSHYGARIAADSLSDYVSELLNRPLPNFYLKPSAPQDTAINPETDLEDLMNLYFQMDRIPLCHPEIVSEPSAGFSLPSAIVIGDSFFWELFNLPLNDRIFKDVSYWYYNSTVFPESQTDSLKTEQLKFPDVFETTDLVILFVNPSNIHNMGWGFLERVIKELYQPEWQKEYDKMVQEYIRAINNTPEWKRQIIENASERGIPLDSMMLLNATYMVEEYLLKNDLF